MTDWKRTLERLCHELTLPSEQDHPLVAIDGGRGLTIETVLKNWIPLEKEFVFFDVHKFFEPLASIETWMDDPTIESTKRWNELYTLLTSHLDDLTGVKTESSIKDLLVIGQSKTGDWVGFISKVVET